jgi:[NiFe] hydrogenase assembly HybE family chaperone
VREDPGSQAAAEARALADRVAALEADFTEIWNAKMRDVPLVNKKLRVAAVGFALHEGRPLGVLVAPWFMNLIQLPAEGEDWSDLRAGDKELMSFPSGDYEFIHNTREQTGGYKACSLFSPMHDFSSHAQAVEVAEAVMVALFDDANRAGTDRAADIRAARETELATAAAAREAAAPLDPAPTRRALITAGLGSEADG